MSTPATSLPHRISRRDLAVYRPIWITVGAVYVVLGISTLAMVSLISELPMHRYQVMGLWLILVGAVHLRSEAPPIGSWRNHAVLVCVWASVSMALWAAQPAGGLALGGAIFIGPLCAFRLEDPRHLWAHITAFACVMFAMAGAGIAFDLIDTASVLLAVVVGMGTPVLALSSHAVLLAAERQGEELERLVRRDPLTGVGNRRMLDERLLNELRRHERIERDLALLALDLNGFKDLNDSVGHGAGDALLMEVAAALVRVAPSREAVIRQGGDEFCLILPETTRAEAERTAAAIRAAIAAIDLDGTGTVVTTGIGIAMYPDDALEAGVLLHVADDRLRANKLLRTARAPVVEAVPMPVVPLALAGAPEGDTPARRADDQPRSGLRHA